MFANMGVRYVQSADVAARVRAEQFRREEERAASAAAEKAAAAAARQSALEERQQERTNNEHGEDGAAAASSSATKPKAKRFKASVPKADRVKLAHWFVFQHHRSVTSLIEFLRHATVEFCNGSLDRQAQLRGYADYLATEAGKRSLRNWVAKLDFNTPGVGLPAGKTDVQRMRQEADDELLYVVVQLRQRGAPVTPRNIVQLRAGQLAANPILLQYFANKYVF